MSEDGRLRELLADGLAADRIAVPGLLGRQLVPLARRATLPWEDLVAPAQWAALDPEDLSGLILIPPERLAAGERALQRAAVAALAPTGWQLVDAAQPWQRPDEPDWWERVRELLGAAPALIPAALLADLGRRLSLDEVPEPALARLLSAELAEDALWRRRYQVEALAAAAAVPGVFPILAEGVARGDLDAAWLDALLADTDDRQVRRAGAAILAAVPDPGRWGAFLLRLVRRLRALGGPPGPELAVAALALTEALALPRDLDLLIGVLALTGSGPAVGAADLPGPLWDGLAALDDPSAQTTLMAALAAGGLGALRLADLADSAGRLRLPWLRQAHAAAVLLADTTLVGRLATAELVALAGLCADAITPREAAYRALDVRMRHDPPGTTAALIAAGAWQAWRAGAVPRPAARRVLALLWLTSPAGAPADRPSVPADLLAAWDGVMVDLGGCLSEHEMRRILGGARHWSWSPDGGRRQACDLAQRCGDVGALAALVESLAPADSALDLDLVAGLLAATRYAALSVGAFLWLCRSGAAAQLPRGVPTLAESDLLCSHAGERMELALRARVAAVLTELVRAPEVAAAALDSPPLWRRADLRAGLCDLLPRWVRLRPEPVWLADLRRRLEESGTETGWGDRGPTPRQPLP